MSSIFKAYDIRGIYPSELNEEIAYKIGRAFVTFLNVKSVVVGRDARSSSPQLFKALTQGIADQGADTINIGLCSTPMFYFGSKDAEASIMITASHNPKEYNGFKLCKGKAFPLVEEDIKEIQSLVEKNQFKKKEQGKIVTKNIMDEFIDHNLKFLKVIKMRENVLPRAKAQGLKKDAFSKPAFLGHRKPGNHSSHTLKGRAFWFSRAKKKLRIILDAGNGMSGYTFPEIFKQVKNIDLILQYCDLDFSFPHHEANPLNYETLKDLQNKVKKEKADLGIATDGDGDRCVFVDEEGQIISPDLMTALIAQNLLQEHPGATILYDVRCSKIIKETIEKHGGKAIICRVGHSFIKKQMREEKALFAGELSGHLYYKENNYTESPFITTALIVNLLSETSKTLSQLIKPFRKYCASGEINSEVKDKNKKMKEVEEKYKDEALEVKHLDGLSMYFKGWWFNLRKSNTENLLRLNLEANSKELMEEKKNELLGLLS